MLPLTPRERFARIMAHQEADRTPIDLAGTSLTALDDVLWPALRAELGLPPRDPAADDRLPYDEEVLTALDVDFRRVGALVGSGDRPIPGRPDRRIDVWGIVRGWTGQYWDIVESPLRGATVDDLAAYPWPDPAALLTDDMLEAFTAEARRLRETTEYVVVGEHPVFGVLELACWMCGFDDFLYRLAGDRPFVKAIFDKLLALQKALIEPYYQAIGPYIHLTTSGDDFGTQTGPFMAPAMFRSLIKPYFAERIAFTKQFTPAFFWHHSCGSVYDLLPDLLDAGVEILNPVQPKARKMEPEGLKAAYGDRVCFHGGFDTQDVLPFGTPDEIEAEVRRVMDALKPNGGYIFSAAHNIQRDVPAQNIVAMYRAAHQLGCYSV
jgi:uroporphyrinogen decarboxylase